MSGLNSLFGLDLWVPTGPAMTTGATETYFMARLRGGVLYIGAEADYLLAGIPVACTNTFEIETRSQRGFKFEWTDGNGVAWHVHGHEPDQGAQAGHVGGQTWVARIRRGQDWLLSTPLVSQFPLGHANYAPPTSWSHARTQAVMQRSHIPIQFAD